MLLLLNEGKYLKLREISHFKVTGPTPRQILAARVALRWSQQDLAKTAGVGISSVRRLEGMTTNEVVSEGLRPSTVQKIVEALEAAGVDFLQESDDRIGIMFSRFLPVND